MKSRNLKTLALVLVLAMFSAPLIARALDGGSAFSFLPIKSNSGLAASLFKDDHVSQDAATYKYVTKEKLNVSPAAIADGFRFPLNGSWSVIQDFGAWNNSFGGYHLAEDAQATAGTPVYAAANGTIKFAGTGVSGYGGIILIEHNTGTETVVSLYGHLSARIGLQVTSGEVSKGQLIAYVAYDDEDGGSWGPHLHFGIRKGAYSTQQICGHWPYVGYSQSCAGITDEQYRDLWYDPTNFVNAHQGTSCSNGSSESYRVNGGVPLHPNGTVIKGSGNTVYLIWNGQKRGITTEAVLGNLYQQSNSDFRNSVITVAADELSSYPDGQVISAALASNGKSQPDGRLIKNSQGEISIVTDNGRRRPFSSGTVFTQMGYAFCNAVSASDYDSYTPGVGVDGREALPTITSSISLSPSGPYNVNQSITAAFSITNKGNSSITFSQLLAGGRMGGNITDFPSHSNVTLTPNQTYFYQSSRSFASSGSYQFFPAFLTQDGIWRLSLNNEIGVAPNIVSVVSATVNSGTAPTVTTSAATNVTGTTAQLNGTANPNGSATNVWFEWGTSSNLSSFSSTPQQSVGSGSTSLSVNASLSGLASGTTYYYRLAASNNWGTSRGSISNFATTAPNNIQVTIQTSPSGRSFNVDGTAYTTAQTFTWSAGSSHSIGTTSTQSGATAGTQYVWSSWSDGGLITHTITPNAGTTITASFSTQHLLTMSAGSGGTVNPSGGWYNSGQVVSISATPSGGFNFSGWSGSGTSSYTGPSNPASVTMNGPITETATFITSGNNNPPGAVTQAASSIVGNGATLNGSVNPNSSATSIWFEWGSSNNLATFSSTSSQAIGSGNTSIAVSAGLNGLAPNTPYYFRVAASNSAGTSRGSILSFTTSPPSSNGETVWIEDSVPNGGVQGGSEPWVWGNSNPTPFSGTWAHQSQTVAGFHNHYFYAATDTLSINAGEKLFTYVFIDPANPPSELMLQWFDGTSWRNAYWGSDQINWVAARQYMGPVPAAGQWTRLEVSASVLGLEGKVLSGMAFNAWDGRVIWDKAGKSVTPSTNPSSVWVEDGIPAGGIGAGNSENWNWVSANPTPYAGSLSHQSNIVAGFHNHFFTSATSTLSVNTGDQMFCYVYIDPANPPSELMLQWFDGTSWRNAYWGSDQINWVATRQYMGPVPAAGQWTRLEVSASVLGLEGKTLSGMAFNAWNGRVTWDSAGKSVTPILSTPEKIWVEDNIPAGGTGAGNSENWNWLNTNPASYSGSLAHQSNTVAGFHNHYFYAATDTLTVNAGEKLFTYVFIDPANPPSELMLQWFDGANWRNAYWGSDQINWIGSRQYMGPIPAANAWVRLEVSASLLGLEGKTLSGMAFNAWDGRVAWDKAGKTIAISRP
jgi:murein DD-endopeptidase MepM/ murein hydrolase activator NlpD